MTSATVPTLAFFGIGIGKGFVLGRSRMHSGLEILFVGSIAARLAYRVGATLRATFGVD